MLERVLTTNLLGARPSAKLFFGLLAIGITYFVLAKIGLALASIHPNATPIWPPTGFALAAVLLWGFRVWPAILCAALLANETTAGSIYTSIGIAAGNTLEALVGAYLCKRWSGGARSFETPIRIGIFALICTALATPISATIGVASLAWGGFAPWNQFASIWLTWWLGDVAGALVVTPVVVLWSRQRLGSYDLREFLESASVFLAAALIGIVAFSPLIEQTVIRGPLSFLAIAPLLWAGLRRNPRDTATVALILSCFAIWGALKGGGPFAQVALNDSLLLLISFLISVSVPSLALSADVTIRKLAEAKLRGAREQSDSMLKVQRVHLEEAERLANLGSWVWDIAADKVTWSEQLLKIYGLKGAQFAGTSDDFLRFVHEDDRERIQEQVSHSLKSGQSFESQERIVRPDGQIRFLRTCGEVIKDEHGMPMRMLGICQDVTDHQHASQLQQESDQVYSRLIAGVRDYAIFMLDVNGTVVSWNIGAARIKGYLPEEIIGDHFSRFYSIEDQQAGLPHKALEAAGREGKYEAEGWRLRKDGSRFWASVVIDAIYEDGKLVGFAKITRDITERRATQEALERTRRQLVQSQKMEVLGQLTGGIAHDFNNLLMVVGGANDTLRRRQPDQRQTKFLDAIQSAVDHGAKLTRQLLTFSRQQDLNPVAVDLTERLGSLQTMLRSSLRGDIKLVLDIQPATWPVSIDQSEFELALVNLAVNARDAMPKGGRLTLSTRNVNLHPDNQVGSLEGEFVAVSVTDTGAGMDSEIVPKIFDPFFTTKEVGKGTGLGLSQVHGFVHQLGGTVVVDSQLNVGTMVTLYLPRTQMGVAPQVRKDIEGRSEKERGTALLVEDNPYVAEVTATFLEQLGYRVLRADNAVRALGQLKQEKGINLMISDIIMPGDRDGLALAREVKSRYPEVRICLMSGYSNTANTADAGFVVLRKPFDLSALEKAIRNTKLT